MKQVEGSKSRVSWLIMLLLMLAMLAACRSQTPPDTGQEQPTETGADQPAPTEEPTEEGPADGAVPETTYNEAPMLTELVAAGELPPVDERLPVKPVVVEPVDRVGEYGGTWRLGVRGGGDQGHYWRTIYDTLFFHNLDESIQPNVAESYDANEDYSEYTIHLREGVKWSDGVPFTADDIMFVWEDFYMNEGLNPGGPPAWLIINGEPPVVEKLDDYTIRFTFAGPFGFFINRLAREEGYDFTGIPKHYAEQFHIDYNADSIEALMEEHQVESWVDLFNKMAVVGDNPTRDLERPVLYAWRVIEPYTGDAQQFILERNPYYFKVDTAGNQLPYLDRVQYTRYEDIEVMKLAALSGEIDFQARHWSSPDRALFLDNADEGGYHLLSHSYGFCCDVVLNPNWNHRDPAMRELIQNLDFRIALSHVVDREEINQIVYLGQAGAYQAAPLPEDVYYHEQLATQYTAHDLELAEEHMQKAGLTRDADGNWLRADGERVSFTILSEPGPWMDALELIAGYWRDFGLNVEWREVDRSIIDQRTSAYDHDFIAYYGVGGLSPLNEPCLYLPICPSDSRYAGGWAQWYLSGGTAGEEPPDSVKQQYDLWTQILATGDPELQQAMFAQILDIAADNFYVIGNNIGKGQFAIVKDNFHNVPEFVNDLWPGIARTPSAQFFKTEQ